MEISELLNELIKKIIYKLTPKSILRMIDHQQERQNRKRIASMEALFDVPPQTPPTPLPIAHTQPAKPVETSYNSDETYFESYGLTIPRYNLMNSLQYKEKLKSLRDLQKKMIKYGQATTHNHKLKMNGSHQEGQRIMQNAVKLLLRAFNTECENAINKVKYSNLELSTNRIYKSFEQLNKMSEYLKALITEEYLHLKVKELYLCYEYEAKKQEEKEALREQRAREREEKQLQKEIEEKKKIIDKDITHFKNMIAELKNQMAEAEDERRRQLVKQMYELEQKVADANAEKEELDYRTANASAGYVYIISNIGSFGKDIVKIGVTRRLDPYERIAELSKCQRAV